jgi:hypothetical protein
MGYRSLLRRDTQSVGSSPCLENLIWITTNFAINGNSTTSDSSVLFSTPSSSAKTAEVQVARSYPFLIMDKDHSNIVDGVKVRAT